MEKNKQIVIQGTLLLIISILLYSFHYIIFRDSHHIFIYLLGDIAFIPLQVFLVALVIEKYIEQKERKHALDRLNTQVGVFYGEFGIDLLQYCVNLDAEIDNYRKEFSFTCSCDMRQYDNFKFFIERYSFIIDISKLDILYLKNMLGKNIQLIVNLLSNPAIVDKYHFDKMLMAVLHIHEEIGYRMNSNNELTQEDYEHLQIDVERVYRLLTFGWLYYIKYLKNEYPYLYNTAVAQNPFSNVCAFVRQPS